jgi:hypothetical protein
VVNSTDVLEKPAIKMEANPGEQKSVAVREEVPKRPQWELLEH